jgi:hypothetical protein
MFLCRTIIQFSLHSLVSILSHLAAHTQTILFLNMWTWLLVNGLSQFSMSSPLRNNINYMKRCQMKDHNSKDIFSNAVLYETVWIMVDGITVFTMVKQTSDSECIKTKTVTLSGSVLTTGPKVLKFKSSREQQIFKGHKTTKETLCRQNSVAMFLHPCFSFSTARWLLVKIATELWHTNRDWSETVSCSGLATYYSWGT